MCLSLIMSLIQTVHNIIMTNIEINSLLCNNNISIKSIEKISPYQGGVCMFKNKNGNCKGKNTFLIHSIKRCVCHLHLKHQQNRVHKMIKFEKKFNKYLKSLFFYINDKDKYIEILKDILLLMINHKKYKYTLSHYYDIVNMNIDNFDIKDDEYNALLDHYKYV
jgi:hypothetical protein